MTRYVLTVNLRDDPDVIETYRDYHRRVWPEVLESLHAAGVERMDIHQLGHRLVMILEVTDGLDVRQVFEKHMASSPRVAEWERLMKSLQEPSSDAPNGDSWTVMACVFQMEAREPAIARAADRSRTS
jgi:L-rhamnose mutarotase